MPKRLVPVYFLSRKFSRPSAWMSLAQDRLLAEVAERDVLVRPFDALLNPLLLLGRGDVHELVADGAAIGPAEDVMICAQRRGFEAQHVVDVDLVIEVGRGEAVARRVKLGMRTRRRQVQADRGCRCRWPFTR